MTHALDDPQTQSLTAVVRHQLEKAAEASTGRSGHTVYGGREHRLRQTVIALKTGQRLEEHDNPGEATVLVLEGRVVLSSGDSSWSGERGDLLTVPQARHELEALEDSAVLLTAVRPAAAAPAP